MDNEYISLRKDNKNLLNDLMKHDFIQIHKSYFIFVKNIESYKKGEVTLSHHHKLSVSLKYRDSLHKSIYEFIND